MDLTIERCSISKSKIEPRIRIVVKFFVLLASCFCYLYVY